MPANRNASARRAARVEEVFGPALPEATEDERARQRVQDGDDDEERYLRERPPHHEHPA
jgi:hypothetical protein